MKIPQLKTVAPKEPELWKPVFAAYVASAVAAMIVFNCGCASPCRFVGAEWDSRSPEQITAATPGDAAVFEKAPGTGAGQESRTFTEWKALFDLISGLRVRLRLIVIESGGAEEAVKK